MGVGRKKKKEKKKKKKWIIQSLVATTSALANLLVRVKLGYPPKFNFLGKPLLVEEYVEGRKKKKEEERIMPSLVATTSAPAWKPCVSTHYVRTNNAKFSGHYVCPRKETVRAHALHSHQNTKV